MTTPQHEDPFGDSASRVLQALAVLTTVGEAAARFAAAGAQNRAAKAEREAQLEGPGGMQVDRAAQRAYASQQRADRALMDRAFDDAWLAAADLGTVANLWRTAALYAMSGDRRAAEVMRRAQNRLAQLNPGLMDAFHRHRTDGMNLADAMRAAGQDVWQHQTRTPHTPGNADDQPVSSSDAGADTQPGRDKLDEAAHIEVARLATGADPAVLEALQRQWRSAGHAPAADAAARLAHATRPVRTPSIPASPLPPHAEPPHAEHPVAVVTASDSEPATNTAHIGLAEERRLSGEAEQATRRALIDQGQPDLPVTAPDEHRDAQQVSTVRRAGAEHDQTAAAQQRRLGQAFRPLGPLTPQFSNAPTPPPARTTAARRRGPTR